MKPVVKKENKPKSDSLKGNKRKDSSRHGVEETLKRAAEIEAERQRQEAEAAQREEERSKKAARTKLNDEEKQKDLELWVRSIPFSEGCIDRIDRAFSDGSLIAEVIHYYCPKICDSRQYFKWYSTVNKISNWQALNRKVFPKLGFRLNQKQIDNLLNPFGCGKFQKDCHKGLFIYKLLYRIQSELAQRNPSVFEYRQPNFVPPSCEKKSRKRKLVNFLDNPPFSRVEMLIERGFYDKDKKEDPEPSCKDRSKSRESLQESIPYNVCTKSCFSFNQEYDGGCTEIYIQPSLSFEWDQYTSRCFLC